MYLCCSKDIAQQLHIYRYMVRKTCEEMVITDISSVYYSFVF